MKETGLMSLLKNRWLDWGVEANDETPFEPIDVQQIYSLIILFLYGLVASIFLLFIEQIVHKINIINNKISMLENNSKIMIKK